jgi:hypothetical protein
MRWRRAPGVGYRGRAKIDGGRQSGAVDHDVAWFEFTHEKIPVMVRGKKIGDDLPMKSRNKISAMVSAHFSGPKRWPAVHR